MTVMSWFLGTALPIIIIIGCIWFLVKKLKEKGTI